MIRVIAIKKRFFDILFPANESYFIISSENPLMNNIISAKKDGSYCEIPNDDFLEEKLNGLIYKVEKSLDFHQEKKAKRITYEKELEELAAQGITPENDYWMCISFGYGFLLEAMPLWKEKEEQYITHPELFEDVTQFDENGKAFTIISNDNIYMPNIEYDCIHEGITYEEVRNNRELCDFLHDALDYIDLVDNHKIYTFLGAKRFVREL
ncbi:MAG: hypothetical protein MJZ29_01705 [Bacteroidaceae bacterium]|nr:hypothetical protein [Bacteroidaceae bacterium]